MASAIAIAKAMSGFGDPSLTRGKYLLVSAPVFLTVFIAHYYMRDKNLKTAWTRLGSSLQGAILALLLFAIALCFGGEDRAFIYFQF